MTLILAISFLWLVRTIKIVLFWLYLWQLKEYHIYRFIDHFRTDKGKKLVFDFLQYFKIILLVFILFSTTKSYFLYTLFLVYFIESVLFVRKLIKKEINKPVFTKKILLLTIVSSILLLIFLSVAVKYNSVVPVLVFDILTPVIVSLIVLLIQPFFVLARNIILEKAKSKIKSFKSLTVIGITGSYGKTSTKGFLNTILSSKFRCLSTPEHKNSEMGIAQTILNDLNESHQIFIVEMGSYSKGGIKLLCDIVKPKIGILTGVNKQHLSLFGSMENLLSAEGGRELAQSITKDGLMIMNGDNDYCLDLSKNIEKINPTVSKKIYSVGGDRVDSDIWTEEVSVNKNSLDFATVNKKHELAHFEVGVLGVQNIQNLLGAILTAKYLGMEFSEISASCERIKEEQAGILLKNGVYGIDIVDSSYSSNPDGVMADLNHLNKWVGKKVIVMPCLIELGDDSVNIHKKIGQKIAEVCDMAIITTKDKFEEIKNEALLKNRELKIVFSEKPKEILNLVTTFCKKGDVVLLEGRVPSKLVKLLIK